MDVIEQEARTLKMQECERTRKSRHHINSFRGKIERLHITIGQMERGQKGRQRGSDIRKFVQRVLQGRDMMWQHDNE